MEKKQRILRLIFYFTAWKHPHPTSESTNQQHPTSEAKKSPFYGLATPTSEAMCQPLKEASPRPPWRSVKKNRAFPVKNEKLFERSEFFSFREMPDFLASERQPAVFFRTSPQQLVFLLSFSFWWQKEKVNPPAKPQKAPKNIDSLSFTNYFFDTQRKSPLLTVPPRTSQSPPPPAGETHAGEGCNGGNEAPPPAPDKHWSIGKGFWSHSPEWNGDDKAKPVRPWHTVGFRTFFLSYEL